MRLRIMCLFVALAAAAIIPAINAQTAPTSQPAARTFANTWLPTPRSQTKAQELEAAQQIKGRPFDPHILTGVWASGRDGVSLSDPAPPMTPLGQAKYDAAKPGNGPRAVPLGNDPIMTCDPAGFPRWLRYNYGMEFVHLPNRVLQFFETYHTYRTIWTDGRVLPTPDDDAEPRFMGYSVGRWEGNTFVVDTTGIDDRSWLNNRGYQHSDAIRVEERYQRTSYDSLNITYTINDPKMYTKPWVSSGTFTLLAGTEIGEFFCVPSQEEEYRRLVRAPAGGEPRR